MDTGGRERLLYELLAFDLTTVNLRTIPKTAALLEQKIHSLDSVEGWLLERLKDGEPTRGFGRWPVFIPKEALVDDYIRASERVGISRRSTETQFFMKLNKLLPGLRPERPIIHSERDGTTRRT